MVIALYSRLHTKFNFIIEIWLKFVKTINFTVKVWLLLTVLAVVLCSWLGVTLVMEVQRPLLYEIQYRGSLAASWQSARREHL